MSFLPICREKALHWATRTGRENLVALLIEAKADVNAKSSVSAGGYAPMSIAGEPLYITRRTPESLRFGSRTALHWAAEKGSTAIARALIQAGASVNTQDYPQRCASSLSSPCPTAAFPSTCVFPDCFALRCSGRLRDTPLMLAARNVRTDIVYLLIRATADLSIRNSEGYTRAVCSHVFLCNGRRWRAS